MSIQRRTQKRRKKTQKKQLCPICSTVVTSCDCGSEHACSPPCFAEYYILHNLDKPLSFFYSDKKMKNLMRTFVVPELYLCQTCRRPCRNVCARCCVRYCSEECQKKDYPRHKNFCRKFDQVKWRQLKDRKIFLKEAGRKMLKEIDSPTYLLEMYADVLHLMYSDPEACPCCIKDGFNNIPTPSSYKESAEVRMKAHERFRPQNTRGSPLVKVTDYIRALDSWLG